LSGGGGAGPPAPGRFGSDESRERARSRSAASETYELTVTAWLTPGVYAAKAVFLGAVRKPGEEEYWSHVHVFRAGSETP
jgi:hypothetical protein